MTKDQARDKVRKLLRLSKSSNMHEAAAAMRQAQALMRQHALEQGELQDRDADEIGECAAKARRGKSVNADVVRLANIVSLTFGVEVYWHREAEFRLRGFVYRTSAQFVGPASRADLARYAFEVLERQMQSNKRFHLRRVKVAKNRAARGDEYGLGWASGVAQVLAPWGVSGAEKDQIAAYMAKHHGDMKSTEVKARTSKAVTHGDACAGYADGKGATLNRGVDGSRQRQLGGPTA